jgi:hypothetical protein
MALELFSGPDKSQNYVDQTLTNSRMIKKSAGYFMVWIAVIAIVNVALEKENRIFS